MTEKTAEPVPPPSSQATGSSLPNVPLTENDELYGLGFDLYPERRQARTMSLRGFIFESQAREHVELYKCEKRIASVIKKSPLVRIMLSALEKAGCPINFRRHLNCEYCEPFVTGGYDPLYNQIVVCYNTTNNYGITESVLFHELIHMFDHCTGNVDFKNVEHLACTEIRAANLTYCNYLSAFLQGLVSKTSLKKQHKACVYKKAVYTVLAARNVSIEEAEAAVKKVFKTCYADLEPVGRQIKGEPTQGDLAYSEAFLLGYD